MDQACLLLCISLLDHTLRGDHFESVVLSFLAVLGIDETTGSVFRSTQSYSPDLSKFIKMAQMLVVQQAVHAAEHGEAYMGTSVRSFVRSFRLNRLCTFNRLNG
jgi:hypothetical protein